MNRSFNPLSATRRHMIQQLVYFDEHYANFSDTYLSAFTGAERSLVEHKIKNYIDILTTLLGKEDGVLAEDVKSTVLIGSQVTIRYEEDGFEESYTLVFPTESDPDRNRISFLSPFGRQLLCISSGNPAHMDAPSGAFRIAIGNVRYSYIGGFNTD